MFRARLSTNPIFYGAIPHERVKRVKNRIKVVARDVRSLGRFFYKETEGRAIKNPKYISVSHFRAFYTLV